MNLRKSLKLGKDSAWMIVFYTYTDSQGKEQPDYIKDYTSNILHYIINPYNNIKIINTKTTNIELQLLWKDYLNEIEV